MSDAFDFKEMVQSLDIGVAIVDLERWEVLFENACFFNWFPPAEAESLDKRIDGFKSDRARQRIQDRGKFTFETETRSESRPIPLRISMHMVADSEPARVRVECVNASKEKESQYMLDSYSKLAEKNARDLEREKERVERLLLNLMPKSVYEELKDFGTTTPRRFDDCSILMLDFVRFTNMTISQDPSALVSELNDIFSAFDRIVDMFGCERLRTIGDSYMAVSGLPEALPEHAENIAKVALRMRRYLEKRNEAHPEQWRCRIGINSGSVIGSLVGVQKYVYDLFGPGVNLAARMESMSEPMRITLCEDMHRLIEDSFVFSERGEFDVKGFGKKSLYYLEGEQDARF